MISEYLSEIELYYSTEVDSDLIKISGDEFNHLVKVMRHSVNDEAWITNGKGEIFKCTILKAGSNFAEAEIKKRITYFNELAHCIFCIPHLRNSDRLEFALEKCTELGITRFMIYNSERTVSRSVKTERWNKIVLSAMKQSLRSYLPEINTGTLTDISKLEGEKILFDQKSEIMFNRNFIQSSKSNYLIIGPEGGLSDKEQEMFGSSQGYRLAPNRLRSETAAVLCASFLV